MQQKSWPYALYLSRYNFFHTLAKIIQPINLRLNLRVHRESCKSSRPCHNLRNHEYIFIENWLKLLHSFKKIFRHIVWDIFCCNFYLLELKVINSKFFSSRPLEINFSKAESICEFVIIILFIITIYIALLKLA
jgi:hypothetical protein